uniref:Putative LOV domain-containing protein n=1 Tax=Cosmarium subtumidum TaxID=328280 RepID=A0A126X347_9VIRI|nr:putative LOV domain-containing protein [Cosmarium subtumidum]
MLEHEQGLPSGMPLTGQQWGQEGTDSTMPGDLEGYYEQQGCYDTDRPELPWDFYPPELGPFRPQNGAEFNPQGAPIPNNEAFRLQVLRRYNVLDTDPDPRYDRITALACQLFKVPVCLVSLVDEARQWFKSNMGLPGVCETDRESSFCAFTLLPDSNPLLVVWDALEDTRFAHNKLVTGPPFIRFYAGAPLVTAGGFILGSFCVIDFKPRPDFGEEQESLLSALAALVSHEMEKHTHEMELQRVQAEKFEEDKKGLLLAIDAFSEGLVLVDVSQPGQPIVFVNEGWERITGYSIEDVVGLKCGALLQGPLSDASAGAALGQAVAEGESTSVEILNYKKDGTPFWNWVRIRPVPTSATFLPCDQNQRYYFGILSDCTLRKEKEMQLECMRVRELEKEAAVLAKRQFVANLSHEIRTPMNAIIACSQLLADSAGLSDDQQELVQMVSGSGQQLLSLISDILDFSKLEANKMSMHDREFSIWGCLDFCMEMLVLKSQTKGLDLAYNVDPSVPRWIWADEVRLRQILTNLLSNAAKFTDEGGEVEVSVTARLIEALPFARSDAPRPFALMPSHSGARHHASASQIPAMPDLTKQGAGKGARSEDGLRGGRTVGALSGRAPGDALDAGSTRSLMRSRSSQQQRGDEADEKKPPPLPWSLLPEYEIRFTVRDTGIGMPKDFAAVIFEAFTQCDNSRSRRYEGTGLGMAIAKDLTERMGGRIWVESEVGKGSTFYFTIRAHGAMVETKGSTSVAVEHAFTPPPTPLHGMRALLVGPTETFQRMVGSMLTSWGMRCTAVRTADEFWQQWRHQQKAADRQAGGVPGSDLGQRGQARSMQERDLRNSGGHGGANSATAEQLKQQQQHQQQQQHLSWAQPADTGIVRTVGRSKSIAVSPGSHPQQLPIAGVSSKQTVDKEATKEESHPLAGRAASEGHEEASPEAKAEAAGSASMDWDPAAPSEKAQQGSSKPPLSASQRTELVAVRGKAPSRTTSSIPLSISGVPKEGLGAGGMARGSSLDQALHEGPDDGEAVLPRSQSCGKPASPHRRCGVSSIAEEEDEDLDELPGSRMDTSGTAEGGSGAGSGGGPPQAKGTYFDVVLVDCPILSAEADVPDKHMPKFVMEYEAALLMMHLGCACASSVPTFLFLAKHTKRQTSIDPAKLANVTVLSRPVRVNQVYKALTERLGREKGKGAKGPEEAAPQQRGKSAAAQATTEVEMDKDSAEAGPDLTLNILIAEDNIVNQRVLLKLLNGMGYTNCATANNGLKVLDHLGQKQFDLILMDLQMPEMDGITATMKLRKELFPDQQPIVAALTADVGYGVEAECMEAGMNWYLSKPIRKEALQTLLDKCAALKRCGNLKAAHLGWLE